MSPIDAAAMPLEGPRLLGIREHLDRATFLYDLAREQKDNKAGYRLMLSAIYSCRGMIELMLEAAEKQEVNGLTRDELEARISPMTPYCALIERIRIHDFHRFGIVPPDSNHTQLFVGGPIKLTSQKGSAAVTVTPQGLSVKSTGSSQVRLQRPLLSQDGSFFDDASGEYVRLEDVLAAFLAKAPDIAAQFEKLVP